MSSETTSTKSTLVNGMRDRRQVQDAMMAVNEALQSALTAARALNFDASTLDETTKTNAAELLTILGEAETTMLRAWTPVQSLDRHLQSEHGRVVSEEQAVQAAAATTDATTAQ